jgi:lipopolysaccharide/colanic/teichoic acid biosynthesis glycosyltransferase
MTNTIDTGAAHQEVRAPQPELVVTSPAPLAVPTRRTSHSKRLFDLTVAVPFAIATLPVTLALGTLSAIRFRQAPLFTQPRLGHGGQEFKFWKIRSLPRFAPETADKYQLDSLTLPKFAQVMRYRHLDEFPQLWLVIAGKMSLVGPRPEMPTLSASFDPAFVAERLSVKPGCTGLWQVSTSARRLIGESPEFDLHYVRNATLRLDLWIAYRTVLAMTTVNEIEGLHEIPRWTGAAVRSSS